MKIYIKSEKKNIMKTARYIDRANNINQLIKPAKDIIYIIPDITMLIIDFYNQTSNFIPPEKLVP